MLKINNNKKFLAISSLILLVVIFSVLGVSALLDNKDSIAVYDFDSCVSAGNPVIETYPAQCRDKNGGTYTESITNKFTSKNGTVITLNDFFSGYILIDSLEITGRITSSWFFEGSFPVKITDSNDTILAEGVATTPDDWTAGGEISFIASMQFEKQTSGKTGWLVLQKDNPSGLPENDDQIKIQISFGN